MGVGGMGGLATAGGTMGGGGGVGARDPRAYIYIYVLYMGVSENRGTLFWGPYNKDPTS